MKLKGIIVLSSTGRLGNKLYAYANLLAFSERTGLTVINLSFGKYAKYFKGTNKNAFIRYPNKHESWFQMHRGIFSLGKLLAKIIHKKCALNSILCRLKDSDEVSLDSLRRLAESENKSWILIAGGWKYRSHIALPDHLEMLRKYFRPVKMYEEQIIAKALLCRPNVNGILCGVHIRRGDFSKWRNGEYNFKISEYASLMRKFVVNFPNHEVRFLICSDERVEQKSFQGLPVVYSNGSEIEDMYLLSRCNYIIGPDISSYSKWASFYGSVPRLGINDIDSPVNIDAFKVAYQLP